MHVNNISSFITSTVFQPLVSVGLSVVPPPPAVSLITLYRPISPLVFHYLWRNECGLACVVPLHTGSNLYNTSHPISQFQHVTFDF